jgi:hypothetical protein
LNQRYPDRQQAQMSETISTIGALECAAAASRRPSQSSTKQPKHPGAAMHLRVGDLIDSYRQDAPLSGV